MKPKRKSMFLFVSILLALLFSLSQAANAGLLRQVPMQSSAPQMVS